MKNCRLSILFLAAFWMSLPSFVWADASEEPAPEAPKAKDQSSANYEKAKHLLPGEEVVTPTGKKVKVWTTEGPVPVSKAPEPFEDNDETQIDDVDVLIDGEMLRREHRRPGEDRFPGPRRDTSDKRSQ